MHKLHLAKKGNFLGKLTNINNVGLHCVNMSLKIFWAVNTSCVILGQIGPILPQKEFFFGKLTNVTFVYVLCPIMPQNFKKILASESWNVRLDNFDRNWVNCPCLEGNFLGKLTNITLVQILNPIIKKHFKNLTEHIMRHNCLRYKVAKVWPKLDSNCPIALKQDFWGNWPMLLLSNYCVPSC